MYRNIGKKIKVLATIICIVTAIIWIILGFVLILREKSTTEIRLAGMVTLIAGPLSCWINSFLLYGYGELIEQNAETNKELKKLIQKTKDNEIEDILLQKVMENKEKEVEEEEVSFYNPMDEE